MLVSKSFYMNVLSVECISCSSAMAGQRQVNKPCFWLDNYYGRQPISWLHSAWLWDAV